MPFSRVCILYSWREFKVYMVDSPELSGVCARALDPSVLGSYGKVLAKAGLHKRNVDRCW